jgi:hypothetical protein
MTPLFKDFLVALTAVVICFLLVWFMPAKANGFKQYDPKWGAMHVNPHNRSQVLTLTDRPCPADIAEYLTDEGKASGRWKYAIERIAGRRVRACWSVDMDKLEVDVLYETGQLGSVDMMKFGPMRDPNI